MSHVVTAHDIEDVILRLGVMAVSYGYPSAPPLRVFVVRESEEPTGRRLIFSPRFDVVLVKGDDGVTRQDFIADGYEFTLTRGPDIQCTAPASSPAQVERLTRRFLNDGQTDRSGK